MIVGVGTTWADSYTITLSSTVKIAASPGVTSNSVTWIGDATGGATIGGYQSGYTGQQFGTGSTQGSVTISTSDISGTITSVVVSCQTGTKGGGTVAVSVGGTSYGSAQTMKVATAGTGSTPSDLTFSGSSSGEIVITLTQTAKKALYVNSITVNYTTGTVTPTCATPTFSPVAGTYTSAQSVTLSTTTENATIYYTTDGNDPTTNSSVYSSAISVSETTTIKAMAVASGYANSTVASATYTIATPLTNIAELTAKTAGSYTVSLTDALVTYVNGTNAYLEDASGAVLLYHCAGDLAVGDKITGTANVTYTVYNNLPEVTAITLADGYTKTSGNTVTPAEVTIATLESNYTSYLSRYVKIVGATVTSAFSSKNSTIEQNGSSIILRDQNSTATLTTTANTTVTVTAHPSIYNTTHQIAVYDQSQIVVAKVDPTIAFNNGSLRVGQTLDLSTLFTSNSDGDVTYSITAGDSYATISGSTLTAVAEGSVTVKAEQAATDAYNAGEATATITVNPELVLSSIAVTTAPTKITYNEGESFDPTGMVVTATYTDNTQEAVTGYTCSPDGALTTSDTEITISYTENNVTKTTTQVITVNEVLDYATLPFEWEGGLPDALTALTGVTANSIGSYPNQTTYQVKLDETGDYIQVKTDSQPGAVTIGVKMVGGASTSTITVQESANGSDFTNVETLSISGSQNSTHTLETSNAFASTTRYVRLYFTKGSNVGVGPITIAKASTDPVINADASVELTAETTSGEIAYTISNPVGGTSLTAAEKTDVDWISDVTVANDKVTFTTTVNTGSERTATITLTYGSVTKDVTVTQAEHIDINTYTLASSITSGKHYVIAATTNSTTVAMGGKHTDKAYYDAIDASLSGETLSVASNSGVQEFVIYGPDADGYYTIYDPVAQGYLYASSSSSNDLSYQTENDDNGRWEIDFENETVTAQGTSTHNLLRYNSGTPRFSCYTSGQTAVQFYEKDGEATPSESITIKDAKYATYSSLNALNFSGTGAKVYKATTTANSTNVTFVEIQDGIVPARTGFIVFNESATTLNIPTSASKGTGDWTNNDMVATLTRTQVNWTGGAGYNYIMQKDNTNNKIVFNKANGGYMPANRAYLSTTVDASNAPGARLSVVFDDDTTTGIDNVNVNLNDNKVYDLQGRRVAQPTKGLYIVNGKKVVIK